MPRKHPKIKGGYIVIPKYTIKCNKYKQLKAYSKAVYGAMLTEFIRDNKLNPENLVKITHNQMYAISGVSHSSIVRAVKELKVEGFIRVKIPGGLELGQTTFQLNGRYLDTGMPDAHW